MAVSDRTEIQEDEMHDVHFAPVCGIYCGACEYLNTMCAGCGYVEGKPFWAKEVPKGVCPLHDCCRNERGLEHCGLCGDFPCKTFLELRDPSLSDEAFAASLDKRSKALKRRAEVGTEKWLAEVSGAH